MHQSASVFVFPWKVVLTFLAHVLWRKTEARRVVSTLSCGVSSTSSFLRDILIFHYLSHRNSEVQTIQTPRHWTCRSGVSTLQKRGVAVSPRCFRI
ncbi:hypothetical protein DFH07DRAFT_855327, partial [Mycena maculata]